MRRSVTDYEQCFMDEIHRLPVSELPKLLKLLRSFKEEFFDTDRQKEEDRKLFWKSFGSWKDDRSAEEIVNDIHASRVSGNRNIQL
ncbi:MAG: hypothetical protein BWK80_07180 [Desulfobacteraceae bacterium IS3]|nr:MAG: hypothetical protein BWK80_07180 [Desulfobacteraceae bacterium IS3]HAO22506.1 hypothetical protein [Desulfobacteraceae bacterium]